MQVNTDIPIYNIFKHNDNYYFYDTYTNSLLNITKKLYEELVVLKNIGWKNYIQTRNQSSEYDAILKLHKRDMLKCNFITDIRHPETDIVTDMLNRSINDLVLQVTRSCNFMCRYCLYASTSNVERTHENINMDFQTAKGAIDFLFEHSCDSTSINISFYGGEPLLNFDLIKEVVEYANSIFKTKKLSYSMTINASLLTDTIIQFIVKHSFNIAISLDGPKDIQNAHRRFKTTGSETYQIVINNINKLKKMNAQYFDTCVTFLPVIIDDEDFEKVKKYYKNMGISDDKIKPLRANLNGIDYILSEVQLSRKKNEEQLDQEFELGSYTNFLAKLMAKNKLPSTWHHNGQCVPGVQRLFVDTFGLFFPCEKITEDKAYSIGSINTGFDNKRVKEFLNIGSLSENQCKHCWAMRFCEMCISACLDIDCNKLTQARKLYSCLQQKESALANMKHYIDLKNR